MLKQHIYLSRHINESEKLKSLAVLNQKTINTHYFSALELAKYLLQLSGVSIDKVFVSNEELAAKLYKSIKEIEYFKKFSFNDVIHLINSLADLRRYIVGDEANEINKLPLNEFPKKNNAIKEAYKLMVDLFAKESLLDEIGIIRYALENTKTFSDIEFDNYNDDYPLHLALLSKASGKVIDQKKNNQEKKLTIASYTKAFGQTNEIENILAYVNDNEIPFDQCVIASAETKDYANIVENYKDLLNLPITIGTGVTLLETEPGKLFSLLNDWMDNLYNTDYFKRVFEDESFNLEKLKEVLQIPEDDFKEINKDLEFPELVSLESILTTIGDLKMSFDEDDNLQKLSEYKLLLNKHSAEGFNKDGTNRRLLELVFVERLVGELNEGLSTFIEKYAKTNTSKDENSLNKILKYLNYNAKYEISYEDTKKAIFAQSVGRESIKEGKLYFTSINNVLSCLRPYLFVAGLSSNNFPGISKENPMLLDEDYQAFGEEKASNKDILRNKQNFFRLLDEASSNGVSIHLSYAYYNSQSLKEQNASSVIFESYKNENEQDKTIEDLDNEFKQQGQDKFKVVEFFNNDVLPVSSIGRAVADNKKVEFEEPLSSDTSEPIDLTKVLKKPRGFSASSVTNYAHCPYLFYLTEVLKMSQPEDIDIYEVIAANECGTLAHYLLETLDKSKVTTKEAFGVIAGKRFDEYLIMHRPSNIVMAKLEKDKFIEMMENAYEMEGDYKTLFREEDIETIHGESGIKIHGFPDKVIENPDGTVRVIDYKTGRFVYHYSYDVASMIQCTMYAYIVEHTKGRSVTSFEYWYLRHKHRVFSNDNGETMTDHYTNLTNVLNALKESLEKGEFIPNKSFCKNCYYKDVCVKKGGNE